MREQRRQWEPIPWSFLPCEGTTSHDSEAGSMKTGQDGGLDSLRAGTELGTHEPDFFNYFITDKKIGLIAIPTSNGDKVEPGRSSGHHPSKSGYHHCKSTIITELKQEVRNAVLSPKSTQFITSARMAGILFGAMPWAT